jgi:N-methylhydantoinase A
VTDCNLVLGRLAPDRFLGGEMKLGHEGARKAIEEKIAKPLGLETLQAADGILRVAVTKMAHMVRWVTTERGLDAADFAMVAYGGAGPLHAALIARELRIGKLIIPFAPGHFSAYGMLFADLRRDLVNTWFKPFADVSFDEMEALYGAMERQGAEDLKRSRDMTVDTVTQRGADMRYVGQEHAVTVDIPMELFETQDRAGIKKLFDAVHETRYGYHNADEKAEIVSLRSATIGLMKKPERAPLDKGKASPDAAFRGKRPVYFSGAGLVETPTYDRSKLTAGNRIEGPALIEEHASTTVVGPQDKVEVDAFGNLHIEIGRA